MILFAGGKARGQAWRQIRGQDSLLRFLQFVGDAAVGHDAGGCVVHGEGSAPVAVARLADRTRIDHVSESAANRQLDGFGLANGFVVGIETFALFSRGIHARDEAALEMSVAKKCEGDGRLLQQAQRFGRRDDVFIFVGRGTVDKLDICDAFHSHGTVREGPQPLEVFGRELVARPFDGGRGDGVEIERVHEAAHGFVMIAAHKKLAEAARMRDNFVGAGAVADNVAKVHDYVMSRGGSQACFQSFEISVNIR